jgi:hypothetical protein
VEHHRQHVGRGPLVQLLRRWSAGHRARTVQSLVVCSWSAAYPQTGCLASADRNPFALHLHSHPRSPAVHGGRMESVVFWSPSLRRERGTTWVAARRDPAATVIQFPRRGQWRNQEDRRGGFTSVFVSFFSERFFFWAK